MPLLHGKYLCLLAIFLNLAAADENIRLSITVSAKKRQLEVSWNNARTVPGDMVLITNQEPIIFEKVKLKNVPQLAAGRDASELRVEGSGLGVIPLFPENEFSNDYYWIGNNGALDILEVITPLQQKQWYTTSIPFDYGLSKNVTIHTKCYGYWASYVNEKGNILASACIKAHPTWMIDMRSIIGEFRIRDLFIPGTHDSGSYRPNFDPKKKETIVTKYALTQDDDIRGQLMHGVRYLDIRVGYYRNTDEQFYINHGITRQRPLSEVIDQVKEFVRETNEIVIFGLKEFPVGFRKNLDIHRKLVQFLKVRFDGYYVDPSVSWQVRLKEVWQLRKNIFIAYENHAVVAEYPTVLFESIEQRWGNVQNWTQLENHLKKINYFDTYRLSSRPIADMAELTPDGWGVILDRFGGLRKMADNVNWRVSQLYQEQLGEHANIVALDFIRGTNIVETALEWNRKKI